MLPVTTGPTGTPSSGQSSRPLRQSAPSLRRKKKGQGLLGLNNSQVLYVSLLILGLFFLLILGLIAEYSKPDNPSQEDSSSASSERSDNILRQVEVDSKQQQQGDNPNDVGDSSSSSSSLPNYLLPIVPVLPIFAPVPGNADKLVDETLDKSHPTIAGVTAILQTFLWKLHQSHVELSERSDLREKDIIQNFFDLSQIHLMPLEKAYVGETIFPVRQDDSIFLSLAAYREHLLAQTMKFAFEQAQDPSKLFIGAVVQNCFGLVRPDGTIDTSGKPCRTGVQVVGQTANGQPKTQVSDAPPDVNGIADFCALPDFQKYCLNGQIRVLYVHETESLGPAMARYYASRLWGGETFFMQCDSHLEFAQHWDDKYISEVRATRNYPKSVLSSYPPGFNENGPLNSVRESNGARLCACETYVLDPNPIVRLSGGTSYRGGELRPTQIPFIAAGFFFARAEFLRDVPFDPYLPYCFMGEEIALSMRAWTHGWDIYAPRKNWIAHQYRPGRMGLPKFWETVNRLFRKTGKGLNEIQHFIIPRIKHMVGYPGATLDNIAKDGMEVILTDLYDYGLGSTRTRQEYMDFAELGVDVEHDAIVCSNSIQWCDRGEKD